MKPHHGLVALLLLSLLVPITAAQPPAARPIHLIYVQPPGATFTADEQAAAHTGVAAAIAFWQDLAPDPHPLRIAETALITVDGDIAQSLTWSLPYTRPPDITLFVIDSSTPLVGDALAQSQTPLALIWALRTDGDSFAATLAHELGHVVYGLPHAYRDADDIMGLVPLAAYQVHQIGCTSLARLGRPCQATWLPIVVR